MYSLCATRPGVKKTQQSNQFEGVFITIKIKTSLCTVKFYSLVIAISGLSLLAACGGAATYHLY